MSRALQLLLALRLRPRHRWRALRWGMYYRHPFCCNLRFALDPWGNQGFRRGGCYSERAGWWVPCGVFHHETETRPEEWAGHREPPATYHREDPFRRGNVAWGLSRNDWERPLWR